jgi:hypothetical protein
LVINSKVAVVWIKSKNLWALSISHMWIMFQRISNVYGIMFHKILHLILCIGFHGPGFMARFVL